MIGCFPLFRAFIFYLVSKETVKRARVSDAVRDNIYLCYVSAPRFLFHKILFLIFMINMCPLKIIVKIVVDENN